MKFELIGILFTLVLTAGIATAQTNSANELPPAIALTNDQTHAIRSIRVAAEKKAAPVALRLAATSKQIYDNMLSDKENNRRRQQLSKEMNRTATQLLAIKGQSIRDMVQVLTPEQRKLIKTEMQKRDAPADLSELIWRIFRIPEK